MKKFRPRAAEDAGGGAVALSLVLLAGAGMMLQTLRNLTQLQFGFEMKGSVVVNVNAGFRGYAP